jgi:hypothetical protein
MLPKRKSLEEKVEETTKIRKSPETLASQFESEGWKFIDLNKASVIRIIPNGDRSPITTTKRDTPYQLFKRFFNDSLLQGVIYSRTTETPDIFVKNQLAGVFTCWKPTVKDFYFILAARTYLHGKGDLKSKNLKDGLKLAADDLKKENPAFPDYFFRIMVL